MTLCQEIRIESTVGLGEGNAVLRQRLESGKRLGLPVALDQNYRYDRCFVSFSPDQAHFDAATVCRFQKAGTDQEQDNIGCGKIGVYHPIPVFTWDDLPIIPSRICPSRSSWPNAISKNFCAFSST